MLPLIGNDWDSVLKDYFESPDFQAISDYLEKAYVNEVIYPSMDNIFTAFRLTSYADVKVVIIGQDPYHGPNQAHGLAFSVSKNVKIPPSLRNMYKEMVDDLEVPMPQHGQLDQWAKQGVLLLNAVLTVRAGEANSHKDLGWQDLTQKVIESLNQHPSPIVYVLWGASARSYKKYIDLDKGPMEKPDHGLLQISIFGMKGRDFFKKLKKELLK